MHTQKDIGYYRWPVFIIALLVITMIGSISVLFIANYDGGAKVVDNYYKKALDFDKNTALLHESQKLGWKATIEKAVQDDTKLVNITFSVVDREGKPLSNLTGKMSAERVGTTITTKTDLTAIAGQPGKFMAQANFATNGLWDITVLFSDGQKVFKQILRQEIL
ncbi:MAG: FixH family protein [Rhodothermia bacterium]|nr:FixH family protein [Rhodothermia bacterium]